MLPAARAQDHHATSVCVHAFAAGQSMERLLNRYLWITGIGGTIVLIIPQLVLLGAIFFVLPGIILALMPTAFFWGATFALLWRVFSKWFGRDLSAFLALAAAALLMVVIPMVSQHFAIQQVATHSGADIIPSTPIALSGNVRIDLDRPRWDQNKSARIERNLRPYACDTLCVALLFSPNIDSVTINKSADTVKFLKSADARGLTRSARTYRVVPKAQCAGQVVVEPAFVYGTEVLNGTNENQKQILAVWQSKMESEACIVASTPPPTHDFLLREDTITKPADAKIGEWWLVPSPANIKYVEIRRGNGDHLLLLQRVSIKAPSYPLMAAINGDLTTDTFGWARTTIDDGKDKSLPLEVIDAMRRYTTLPFSLPNVSAHD